jgi:hypothetical protein
MEDEDVLEVYRVPAEVYKVKDFVCIDLGRLSIYVHSVEQAEKLLEAAQEALSLCRSIEFDAVPIS